MTEIRTKITYQRGTGGVLHEINGTEAETNPYPDAGILLRLSAEEGAVFIPWRAIVLIEVAGR